MPDLINQSHPGPGFCPSCGQTDTTFEHAEECLATYGEEPPPARLDTSSPADPQRLGELR